MKTCKCDTCYYMFDGPVNEVDWDVWCDKGHWSGAGPDFYDPKQNGYSDIWDNCEDYKNDGLGDHDEP